jgi:ABC-type ATPase involved in cell division/GNAT superfamily N-acetyltransferase
MHIVVESAIERTPRVVQLEGLFDIAPEGVSRVEWDVDLPLDEQSWSIGLVTGPSGSGKSTIARELFGDDVEGEHEWPRTRAVVEGFPESMSIRDVTRLLSSVGFSSPPAWLRPYHVLSTGERFRSDVARSLAEAEHEGRELLVLDEFTSVVDRQVAKIGSAAIAKTVRRTATKLIAVTCHEDVIEWLQPDWTYMPATGTFGWRSVQPRPAIELVVGRCPRELWGVFAPHHYLSRSVPPDSRVYVGFVDDVPVGCYTISPFRHQTVKNAWRATRLVVLPDWQGIGLGFKLASEIAGCARAAGCRFFESNAHPARIAALSRSPQWKLTRGPGFMSRERTGGSLYSKSAQRMTTSWEYVGPAIESELTPGLVLRHRRELQT